MNPPITHLVSPMIEGVFMFLKIIRTNITKKKDQTNNLDDRLR